ncbi:MAG: phosphate acyltransferase PlsX [Bacilli bacterium]|nr:phosphate acyltransferase PlsX [Bacilli bacterium]
MIRIAIDLMGGDLGSAATLEGVNRFKKEHDDVELILVGKKEELPTDGYKVIEANDVLPMTAGALDAIRKKDSSMYKAISCVANKEADAVVSCGSTGAYLSASALILKKIPGVSRPALIAPFPTKIRGKKVVILDVGASNENSGEEIAQFAMMGNIYAKSVLEVETPKVYVLSNGTEEGKGSPEGKEAAKILSESKKLNFCGNIEAREALSGEADVIATDGFSGNVLLKGDEGIAKMMSGMIKQAFKRNIFSMLGYLLAKKGFKEMTKTMDYKNTGGAMLVGVNGVVVKAHGSSDGLAFYHAIDVAYKLAKSDLVKTIEEGLAQ